jgi:hypothetical protein
MVSEQRGKTFGSVSRIGRPEQQTLRGSAVSNWKIVFKSKTFWGTVLASVAHVLFSPPEQRTQATVEGAGAILAAAGVRTAISKNGTGQ